MAGHFCCPTSADFFWEIGQAAASTRIADLAGTLPVAGLSENKIPHGRVALRIADRHPEAMADQGIGCRLFCIGRAQLGLRDHRASIAEVDDGTGRVVAIEIAAGVCFPLPCLPDVMADGAR